MRPAQVLRLGLVLACVLLGPFSCATVRPWEREYLAKKPMALDPDPEETTLEQLFLDAREGSAGGYGAVGGGCGCN